MGTDERFGKRLVVRGWVLPLCFVLMTAFTWPWEAAPPENQSQKKGTETIQTEPAAPPTETISRSAPPRKSVPSIAKPPSADPEVDEIRHELRNMLQVHDQLKERYRRRAEDIRALAERTQRQERILEQLEAAALEGKEIQSAVLGQEDFRMLQEETDKNQKLVKRFDGKPR